MKPDASEAVGATMNMKIKEVKFSLFDNCLFVTLSDNVKITKKQLVIKG